MVTTIAKRIQTRLSRKGIKASLGDIRPIYNEIVADVDNPTAEEIEAIFNHFMSAASQLSVVEEQPQPVPTDHEETAQSKDVDNLYTDVYDTPQAEEMVKAIASEYSLSLPADIAEELAKLPTEEEIRSGILAYIHKINFPVPSEEEGGELAPVATSELVASTAESMGIALNLEDVTAIAENFDYASTNSDDELEEIKSAITAFVQHKAQITQQKIDNIVQEVKQTIHHLDAENSQHLNEGLRSISQSIKSGSERFRQQTRQALKVFALPPSKAG